MTSAGEPMIVAENLTRRFGAFTAVDSVNFSIDKGSIFGFLGPNGSGKSTVIRLLCGLLTPSDGRATLDGIDVRKQPEAVKERIGYTSQRFSLYEDLTVEENILFFGRVYGLRAARLRSRRDDAIELTGIGDYLKRLAGKLSGGWKQRLAVACALLHEPRILFLDEPTAGIDPVARRELWDLLFRLSSEGKTLFVTTHYMDEAERCSHIGYIYLSKLIICGYPAELKRLPEVTPPGYRRLQIDAERPSVSLAALRGMEGVADATLFGSTIHLLVRENLSEDSLLRHLEGKGLKIRQLQAIDPTLEDVFVMLTRKYARKGLAIPPKGMN